MKTKMLALLELAVVLCSLLLVATSPSIATDQNQELQKVSACTVTTTSNDDIVLGVYGNANEDETIDMRDLTYVKLIFFGERPKTELADAKYDGEINPLDFVQIKLMIVGKEKELTVVQYLSYFDCPDITEEPVTVPMPIERIVVTSCGYGPETLCAFGEADKIIGVDNYAKMRAELKTFLEDKPSLGSYRELDMEKILELNLDIVIAYGFACHSYTDYSDQEKLLNAAGIPLVQMDFFIPKKFSREIRNLGWLLGKQERAEKLINFEQQHIDLIKERVADLKPEEKTRVYYCGSPSYYGVPTHTAGKGDKQDDIELCGGINIFSDIKSYVTVDPEAVIERNPQVIFASESGILGYSVTDTAPAEEARDSIMNYPGFDHIDAVKNGRVYCVTTDTSSTHHSVWLSYMAKYFYPELFEDVDPVEIHREWMETFLGVEYKGVYAYPTYPVS